MRAALSFYAVDSCGNNSHKSKPWPYLPCALILECHRLHICFRSRCFSFFMNFFPFSATIGKGRLRGKLPMQAANQQLVADYFDGENSTYTDTQFRRRFRMKRPLFIRILEQVTASDEYFHQRPARVNSSQRHRQLRDDLKNHLFENFPIYTKKLQR